MIFEGDFQNRKLGPFYSNVEIAIKDNCLKELTHTSFAKLYYHISHYFGDYIVSCPVEDNLVIYMWDRKSTLYCKVKKPAVFTTMMDTMETYFRSWLSFITAEFQEIDPNLSKRKREEEMAKIRAKMVPFYEAINKVGTCSFMKEVAEKYIYLEKRDDFLEKLNSNPYVLNFKNGIIDMKEDFLCLSEDALYKDLTDEELIKYMYSYSFRKRDPNRDFYTFCLDFDFRVDYDRKIYDELCTAITRICNDDNIDTELVKSYFGYSMVGVNSEQRSFWLVGPLASNGKSTLVRMFMCMFGAYSKKLNYRTFEKGYQKQHKQFAECKNKRFVFLEEISRKNMDIQLFKDIIGDPVLGSNEILFGTTEDINITFTFCFASNNNPSFQNDNGIKRRGMIVNTNNKFIDKNKYDKRKEENKDMTGYYVKDKNFLVKMENEAYKLALFHIFYDYALDYVKNGEIPEERMVRAIKAWEDICKENDTMKSFIDQFFEITKNSEDVIHKDTFLQYYQTYTGLGNISFNNILNDIKRLKITYDRMKQCNKLRGCLVGIKRNTEDIPNKNDDPDKKEKKKAIVKTKEIEKTDNDIVKEVSDSSSSEEIPKKITVSDETGFSCDFDN